MYDNVQKPLPNIMDNRVGPQSHQSDEKSHSSSSRNPLLVFLENHLVGIKRMQYGFIITACTVVLGFQVAKCAEKYMNKSTGTADKYVHVSKTAFPELTICPTYPYKLDILQANGIETRNALRFGSNWIPNSTQFNAEEFYRDIVLDVKAQCGIMWKFLLISF